MCNEFFCQGCRRHKKLELRSSRKAGKSFYCTACEIKLRSLNAPKVITTRDGVVFTIAAEHIRTSRINMANKRAAATTQRMAAYWPG